MKVCLVSGDASIRELAEEVVGKSLLTAVPGEPLPEADVYVWDVAGQIDAALVDLSRTRRYLFLVDPSEVPLLGQRLTADWKDVPACILLKPLRRPVLECFLGSAAENVEAQTHAQELDRQALSADRASLLQYALDANLKLQQYDQERTSFLVRYLHDLRAPVTAVQGYCGLLLGSHYGELSEPQRDLIGRMLVSARRLARLSTSMFDFSVQGYVQQELELAATDIEGCLDQALHELSQYFEEKQLSGAVQLEPPGHPMLLEEQRIEQLLINLVENACKFSPSGAEIVIRGYPRSWHAEGREDASETSRAYQIDIEDSGPGIARDTLDMIFEPYYRATGNDNRSGSGLGLAICKMIVEAHGGAIWATSEGKGAKFSVILPAEPPRRRMSPQGTGWNAGKTAKAV